MKIKFMIWGGMCAFAKVELCPGTWAYAGKELPMFRVTKDERIAHFKDSFGCTRAFVAQRRLFPTPLGVFGIAWSDGDAKRALAG